MVREQTLKSVLTLITKLSDRSINGELLKYLAKTANDEQPGIRTNTTICLGKIAKHLGTASRAKVLIAAFSRSLRDPFVHARNAALMALAVTGDYFSDDDCATRIMPALCPLLIDKEKLVRDQATKTMDVYIAKVKKAAAGMPDSVLPPEAAREGGPRMSTPQPESSNAASWAGWAISSFTNKLSAAAGEIQESSNGTAAAAAASKSENKRLGPTSSASALHRQALKSPSPSAPMSRSSSTSQMAGESFFPDPDPVDDDGDAWGDMDEGGEDFFNDATSPPQSATSSSIPPKRENTMGSRTASGGSAAVTATPFDDSEPDFAGWLAAQSSKKSGTAKALPKGLAKIGGSSSGAGAAGTKKTTVAVKPKAKPVVAKKIDLKPKETGDDDGWGDGW